MKIEVLPRPLFERGHFVIFSKEEEWNPGAPGTSAAGTHTKTKMQIVEQNLAKWVLVYNVHPPTQLSVLNALTQFGQVSRYYKPAGNILFAKFQQPLSAEVAAMKRTLNVTDSLTIGVLPVSKEVEQQYPTLAQMNREDPDAQEELINVYPEDKQPRLARGLWYRLVDMLLG